MIILGIAGMVSHDAAAALFIDGKLVAAAEEERFVRIKHAKQHLPIEAIRYCLEFAGIEARDVDIVAMPYAKIARSRGPMQYALRHWYAPDRAVDALLRPNRRYYRNRRQVLTMMTDLGMDLSHTQLVDVEHHLAHASSAYHLSGFQGKTAILGIDGKGEYATTFFGYGENGQIHKIKEFYDPDSLGGLYGALTQFLGFDMLDGEFKVMGMAPYGNPNTYDFSRLLKTNGKRLTINNRLVNVLGLRRYRQGDDSYYFSKKLVDWLGQKREGDDIDDPYVDYAASIQTLLEKTVLQLVDTYLGDIIRETGQLCYAGGVALNVKLNQKLMKLPGLRELFVQPAAGDAGTAIGAAAYVAERQGVKVAKLEHVYLGPSYTSEQCEAACIPYADKLAWQHVSYPSQVAADLLAEGHPVAWFQGRMEFGPRALGNRSILGNPSASGVADRINAQIKYRERWRPFCPSMLDTVASDILQSKHPSPYMTFTFEVAPNWRERIPEVVHEDGTARAQIVDKTTNPRYYALIEALGKHTGNPVVLNTSLNRRGEPMVCSPTDAIDMFLGSDLHYLVLEDWLVTKTDVD